MLRLPRIYQDWPWPRQINPHYEEIKGKSLAWYLSTFPEIDAKLAKILTAARADLLGALSYPNVSKEILSVAADLLYLFGTIDTFTEPLDVTQTREVVDAITDALRNPNKTRPTGESFLGTVAQKFWARFCAGVTSVTARRHFIDTFCCYLESAVDQVHGRETQGIPSIGDYLSVRRLDIGAYPCFALAETAFELPDKVYYHPVVVELSSLVSEMIIFDNDLHSYNKEQSTLEVPYNIITVLMHQNDYSVEQAMEKAVEMNKECQKRFLELWNELPSWGPVIDPIAKEYVQGLANWVGGNYYWQFECGRYFGSESAGKQVLETGMVMRLPKFNPISVKC